MPAMKPPAANAPTFTAVRLTPTLWAASSSSPTALSTAPARERSVHQSASMTRATITQMKIATSRVLQPFSGKKRICLNPSPPCGPTTMPFFSIW